MTRLNSREYSSKKMKKLIKSILLLLKLKIQNNLRKVFKKPLVVERDGKEFIDVSQVMKKSNRHARRAMMAYARKHPDKIIHT